MSTKRQWQRQSEIFMMKNFVKKGMYILDSADYGLRTIILEAVIDKFCNHYNFQVFHAEIELEPHNSSDMNDSTYYVYQIGQKYHFEIM